MSIYGQKTACLKCSSNEKCTGCGTLKIIIEIAAWRNLSAGCQPRGREWEALVQANGYSCTDQQVYTSDNNRVDDRQSLRNWPYHYSQGRGMGSGVHTVNCSIQVVKLANGSSSFVVRHTYRQNLKDAHPVLWVLHISINKLFNMSWVGQMSCPQMPFYTPAKINK